jgi:hypothetical protein
MQQTHGDRRGAKHDERPRDDNRLQPRGTGNEPERRVGDPKPEIEKGGVGAHCEPAALRRAANRFPGIGTSFVGAARDPAAGLADNLEAPLCAD